MISSKVYKGKENVRRCCGSIKRASKRNKSEHREEIIDIIDKLPGQYKVRFMHGTEGWVLEDNLLCPKLKEKFEYELKLKEQKQIVNEYNAKLTNNEMAQFGYDRNVKLERVIGAIKLENIPVLEAKFQDVDETDLILWEEIRDNDPQILLEFYLKMSIGEFCRCT